MAGMSQQTNQKKKKRDKIDAALYFVYTGAQRDELPMQQAALNY